MAAFNYALTYGGVPFVGDRSTSVFPLHSPTAASRYQSEVDILDEINRLIDFAYLRDFALPDNYPGKNLAGIAHPSDLGPMPNASLRIGDWYYPTGVRRWGVFRGLATSSQVKAMLAACRYEFSSFDAGFYSGAFGGYQSGSVPGVMNYPQEIPTAGTGTIPADFVMKCVPNGATQGSGPFEVRSSMHMLPPRPLGELAGKFDGLYLVTLVDERFYMQTTPALLELQQGMTWEFLLNELAITLGISLSTFSAIEGVYGQPELDSPFWALQESAAALLDAVALNVGRSVVRNYDGSYVLYTPLESQQIVNTNRGIVNPLFPVSGHITPFNTVRTAGGDMFVSGTAMPAGNLTNAKNWVVPNNVVVSFPKFIVGNDPVPHFVDRRTQSARSRWYEDSYGGVYSVVVPITSGGINVSGLVGQSDSYIHDTAKALLSGEVAINSGVPLNNSGLVALSMQLANNYYNNQVGTGIDEVYPGIVQWVPEGLCDLLFTYSEKAGGAFTRAMRKSWTNEIEEFQHSTPNMSGFASVPGQGGKSVAQTIRDSFGQSGSFVGLSGTNVPLDPLFPLSGTWVQSGAIQTRLNQTLLSGSFTASFLRIDHFPTQNRWWGKIIANGLSDEIMLFEGTSGGVAGIYSGNLVGIVQRGAMGTIQRQHENQSVIAQTTPDAGYNVNLITHEKGQFVYPSEWTSGGIQGVNIVPQVQTVRVLDITGTTISGVQHFSGRVAVYDSTRVISGGPWLPTDLVWVVDRTSGSVPTLSGLYEGQFVGYSASQSGMQAAPIYAVDSVAFSQNTRGIVYANFQNNDLGQALLTQPLSSGVRKLVIEYVDFMPPSNRWWVRTAQPGLSSLSGYLRLLLDGTSGGITSGTFLSGYVYTSGGSSTTLTTTAPPNTGFFINIVTREVVGDATLISEPIPAGAGVNSTNENPGNTSGTQVLTFWDGPGAEKGLSPFPQNRPGNYVFPGGWLSGFKETVIQPQFQMVAVTDASGAYWSGTIKYQGVTVGITDDVGNNLYTTNNSDVRTVFIQRMQDNYSQAPGITNAAYSGNYTPPIESGRMYFGMLVGYSSFISGGTPGISGGSLLTRPVYAVDHPMPDTDTITTGASFTVGGSLFYNGTINKFVNNSGTQFATNADVYIKSPLGEGLTIGRKYTGKYAGLMSGTRVYIADRHTFTVMIDALTYPDVEVLQVNTTASGTPGLFATPSTNNLSGSPRVVTIGYHA